MKIVLFFFILFASRLVAADFYIAPDGRDTNEGSIERPFATLEKARERIRTIDKDRPVTVVLRGGTYFLKQPFKLDTRDSGVSFAPVTYKAYPGEQVTLSGGRILSLKWRKYKNGILRARVDLKQVRDATFDQLFINGERYRMARYPNYDLDAKFFGGTSPDAVSPERVRIWKNPTTGYLHALHKNKWGSLHYAIKGVNPNGTLELVGGWQNNFYLTRYDGYHKEHLFVENIIEELDDAGEWFFDRGKGYLYLKSYSHHQLKNSEIITTALTQLVQMKGTDNEPVQYIRLEGLDFRHTNRIFMESYDRLLRGDWSISRSGAVFIQGTEHCEIVDCNFENLGGNAVFINHYNRKALILGCRFVQLGENAVCLVGDSGAVRNPYTKISKDIRLADIDLRPGPKTNNYPADCLIENNLIHDIGLVGKQTAGVIISMAEEINISHNTIYDIPRAAICLNDGCWGGHVIEHNDAFNTVRESGDHGPFNSWGRDRNHHDQFTDEILDGQPWLRKMALIDNCKLTIIRHNRFAHPGGHSWGIDLDDGSSNYHIYNNLCLGMGIKLREGFFRRVENNIMINGFGGFHVWYDHSGDVIRRNVVINKNPWQFIKAEPGCAREIDYNLFFWEEGEPEITGLGEPITFQEWQKRGFDTHSQLGNPLFVDPDNYDYRVKTGSPALDVGFENFRMDNFGVYKPEFAVEAAEEERIFATPETIKSWEDYLRSDRLQKWLGGEVKNLKGEDERSAWGMGENTGVIIKKVPKGSMLEIIGFQENDLVLKVEDQKIHTVEDLMKQCQQYNKPVKVYIKNRGMVTIKLNLLER